MKKIILLLFAVSILCSAASFAQIQQRLDSFYVKYSGTALQADDSLIIYSKPDKFKVEEYFISNGSPVYKLTYLIGQEMTVISNESGETIGTRVVFDRQSHDEIISGIEFISLHKYSDYSTLVGSETLLGYPCSIYENAEGSRIWVVDNTYILKGLNKVENTETTAYEFMLNAVINDKVFEIPSDVEIKSLLDN
jgi:hypothetical protein